ncbi:glycoside hydrolase family 43 protein [Paenibacillus sp. NPDC058071]|uniref:glycoside hydrolase family 43 protein n=1 Tax=Paenibacillus sp. NPDC058071 TaxID=3346326 RepID=UPI0036D97B4E
MLKITNPILRGFNPDPSFLLVEDTYYIATSTFEWFPGVQIHASTDLVNWEVVARPLNRLAHLDMRGNPASGGIWAPCLSYANGKFYLIYTDVKAWGSHPFKDTHNYLVTSESIEGPWSAPVYLNSSGFDPSLFHDKDGKKWLLNMEWDYRYVGGDQFTGILLQEYCEREQKLVGPIHKIFKGSELSLVEGPHIYKVEDYYYLFTAEGGTSYDHAETVARSKCLTGPYEMHPNTHLITSKGYSGKIQKAGHGSLCQGKDGKWYFAHLCGRPVNDSLRCVLGRETSLQEVVWREGWPYLANGTLFPSDEIEIHTDAKPSIRNSEILYQFHDHDYLKDFQTLRIPLGAEIMNITERPGYLRLHGRESVVSMHTQSMVCRRQDTFVFQAETKLEFHPTSFQHKAGLIYRYNEDNLYYLYVTYDEQASSKVLHVLSIDNGSYRALTPEHSVHLNSDIYLRLEVNYESGQFYYSSDSTNWNKVGEKFDTTILSDEYANPMGFTGAFVGMCCQDLNNHTIYADFEYFKYSGD